MNLSWGWNYGKSTINPSFHWTYVTSVKSFLFFSYLIDKPIIVKYWLRNHRLIWQLNLQTMTIGIGHACLNINCGICEVVVKNREGLKPMRRLANIKMCVTYFQLVNLWWKNMLVKLIFLTNFQCTIYAWLRRPKQIGDYVINLENNWHDYSNHGYFYI